MILGTLRQAQGFTNDIGGGQVESDSRLTLG